MALAIYSVLSFVTSGVLYWHFSGISDPTLPWAWAAAIVLGVAWPVTLPYTLLALVAARIAYDAQE